MARKTRNELKSLTTSNASTLSTLISAPVALHRVAVYPIANYGSAMAPFCTILTIWVGAIILCAMLKVTISDREKAHVLGLGDTLPRIAGPSGGERLTLGTASRPRVFRTVRDLRTARVAAGHTRFAWVTCISLACRRIMRCSSLPWGGLPRSLFSNIVYTLH